MDLRERVFAALNGKVANGFEDVKTDDAALIAADLMEMSAFDRLDDYEAVELEEHIIEWQKSFA